ncbi:LysR substrate-binding domain-containing protein [uncultured Bilophila sp.]|uniref:LysR substrate-binding domain-containing protein n=1 Tax=uncultured Bilophila sp. TaxID=529385 RepID=UPI00280B8F84|nr:LysR substrate-binding domain-containing protein [uncultured Bilophila sp.]
MTLRYLEIFLALARTPNMRDAAAKLFISQAAVSSALRDFEAELGVPLFDRMGRGIRLNDKGRLLEERLAPLYNQLKNVLALVASDELAGKIRIGASTTLSDFVLPQVLYNFKMRNKQVEIECESGNTADIVRHVEHGLLDVGFVEGEVNNLAVEVTPLAKESLVIVTADKALADSGPYRIEDLLDRHWLLREPGSGTRETFLRQLIPRGLRPHILLEFEHNDPIKQVLRNSGILSCLSPHIVQREVSAGELFIVSVSNAQFDRTIYRVEHKDRPFSSLRDALAKEVQACLEEQERLCPLVLKGSQPLPAHEKERAAPQKAVQHA